MKRISSSRMFRALAGLLLCAAIGSPSVRADKRSAPQKLDRVMDKVVISGAELRKTRGRPISQLRLMAFQGDSLAAVPFQIDKKTPDGKYVMGRASGPGKREAAFGRLDHHDELVFMAHDAGERGDPAGAEPPPELCDEISLLDPATEARAWAYLCFYDQPPPLSTVSYMQYRELSDYDEVNTPHYSLRFPKRDVFIRVFIIHESAGGSGQDLLDRIKMRSGIKALRGAVTLERTEEDFVSEVLGVVAGPIRIIRRTGTRLDLMAGFKSPSVVVDGSFYPCSFEFPSMLSLPFRMDMLATDAYIRQGWDLNRNAIGLKFYSNLNPEPVVFDGKMSAAEFALAENTDTLHWALITGPQGTWMFRGVWDKRAPFTARLYYEDDLSRLEPPEDDPGVMGFAYLLEDLLKMGGAEYPFNIENYVVPDFDGDLQRALRVFDYPLEIEVTR